MSQLNPIRISNPAQNVQSI